MRHLGSRLDETIDVLEADQAVLLKGVDRIVVLSPGFKRLLMGSVSTYVVNNAPCPVVVVRIKD